MRCCAGLRRNACTVVCAPARPNLLGLPTWRILLGPVDLAGVGCQLRKLWKHLSWHMSCAFSFLMWGCVGVPNVCIALHMSCAQHCTCVARTQWCSIYHGTCAAHFHCSFGVVVGWGMEMWWRGFLLGGCTGLSIPNVLSSCLVDMYSLLSFVTLCICTHDFSAMYVSHLCLVIVGPHLFFLRHGVS